jgi:predicted RNA-binding Zn-ribbon protein involved in translation (DUF1610 family)
VGAGCYACGAELRFQGVVGRRAECPDCGIELHACLACRHHDQSAAHGCREPHADPPADKERANACEFFQLGEGAGRGRQGSPRAARDALAALFGEAPRKEPDPREALEALFRKK